MKKLFLITIILILQSFPSFGKFIEGNMNCEIKSQSIETVDNGQIKKYKSFSDGLLVGDTFNLNYSLFKGRFSLTIDGIKKSL